MTDKSLDAIEVYADYVNTQLSKLTKYTNLMKNDDFDFYAVNTALASNLKVATALNSEYRRLKFKLKSQETSFKIWYSEKFIAERMKHNTTELSATKYLSKNEIECLTIANNKTEYIDKKAELQEIESRVDFLRSLREDWKSNNFALKTLSENLRSEWFGSMNSDKDMLPERKVMTR